jgi:glycosyltransferase involved in cell wall biosynthesis
MALKILFVIDGLGTGGAERSLAEALPLFKKNGIKPIVVCFHERAEGMEQSVAKQGFDLRFIRTTSWLERMQELRKVISLEKPEILHSTLFESNVAGRLAALGKPTQVLNSLVNTPYVPIRRKEAGISPAKHEAVRLVDSWTARLCTDHFHAITHTVKQHAVKSLRIAPDRVTVVERGRDPLRLGYPSEERRQRARLQLGLSADAEVLVNLGRLEYQKGQKYLLQAAVRLSEHRPHLTVLIAGRQGSASKELADMHRKLGLDNIVRFLGYREDAPEILASADLFVFPSLFEGLGGALIEAMALALPIVASDLPELREVVEVGQNAVLVQPASPDDLQVGIEAILEDRQRMAQFGQRSRAIFEERFTLEQSAMRMVELYHKVAERAH